ncbi:MAG: hypothetical protein R6W96_06195 [Clostridia bacterium]
MKAKVYTVLTVLFAVVIVISGMAKSATSQNLVLASVDYVDAKINELNARISSLQTGTAPSGGTSYTDPAISTRLDTVEKKAGTTETTLEQVTQKMEFYDFMLRDLSEGAMYQVIRLNPGDKLLASSTSELILRSGSAKAIGNVHDEGLANVTTGTEIKNGQNIPRNHMLVIPRGDGRGIVADTECYILFKGVWYMN